MVGCARIAARRCFGVKVSIHIDGHEGVTWPQWLTITEAVERHGLKGLYLSDHYGSFHQPTRDSLDSWTVLAAITQRSQRIRLGVLMSATSFRHPSVLARVVTTADHASDGRVNVGIGAGWYQPEHARNGFRFEPTGRRLTELAEQLEILTRSWSGASFSHSGARYELADQRVAPVPLQAPHPPIIVGGEAKRRSASLAAQFADEYNHPLTTPDGFPAAKGRVDDACKASGRDPGTMRHSVFLGAVLAESMADLKRRVGKVRELMPAWAHRQVDDLVAGPPDGWLIGLVGDVRERIARFEALGASHAYLKLVNHQDIDQITLYGMLNGEDGS